MSERALFLNCIGISAIIHTALFAVVPLQTANIVPVPQRPLEVAYQQTASNVVPAKTETPETAPWQKPLEALKKNAITEFIKNDLIPKSAQNQTPKPYATKDQPEPKKTISLPNVPGETFKSPEYKSYYQVIREKIRRQAYASYKNLEEGEVFLTFVLSSDGSVKDLMVNSKKTNAGAELTDIASRSVKEAAPFPEFPEKLQKNTQLSFNVIISFEFK